MLARFFTMKKISLLARLCLGLFAYGIGHAGITLTEVPAGMRKQNAVITVGWIGGAGRVHLRASTVPGGSGAIAHYDSLHLPSLTDSATLSFKINPDIPALYRNSDLRFGVNYCIATDGITASPEFIIIIESNTAPVLNSPANAASIRDLAPTFSWSGDAPYHTVLVSDEPFKISDSGTVTGISSVWQIITPFASARYGDADPSGFNTVSAPPLISGKTYNWLVLNNYGNNNASTSKVAPVPFSFVYATSTPLASPLLLEPKAKDTIPGSDQIRFRWSLVDGAVSYKVELLEENLVNGSQADVVVWKTTSTGGQINLDNATGLLRRYSYKWRVYAMGSNGSASLSEKRTFFFDVEVGEINLSLKSQSGAKVAYAPIKLNRLGGSSSGAFQSGSTNQDGVFIIKNAPLGTYEAHVDNLDGYAAKVDTVIHNSKDGTKQTITLQPVLGKILGKISALPSATGILNAKIVVSGSNGIQLTTLTNSQGNYSLGLPLGNWLIRAQADGYLASTTATASLNSTSSSKNVDFSLEPNQFTLSGTVSNSFSHQGIFGATVFLTMGGETRTVNTDGQGSFSFSVSHGVLSLRVSSPGFAAPEPQSLTMDGDKSVNVALDPNASILSGRSRDNSGTGLFGVLIQATPKAGAVRSVLSDNQGYFELSLPAGDWLLTASSKAYSSQTTRKFFLDISKTVQGVDFTLEPNRAFISGRATVNATGLSGMKIGSADAYTLTDNSGYYLLSVIAGTRSVQANKEGYLVTRTYTVPVNPGDTVSNIDFSATANAGILKGRVLAGGAGVVKAQVKAINQSNREVFLQATDFDGTYSLSLPSGDYQVTATKEGFALDHALTLSLPPGGIILDGNFRMLSDQGGISGTVATGNTALGGCGVSYRNEFNSSLAGKTVTDPLGRYALSLQAGAKYFLTADCQGFQLYSQTTENLDKGSSLGIDFNLSKADAIGRGKVVDFQGGLLSGVKVTADKEGTTVVATSDFSGLYSLSLGAGTYAVTYSKIGYRTFTKTLQLSLGDNQMETDSLAASVGKLAGRITADGIALSRVLVTLVGLSPEAGGGAFVTDADGRFSGENLPAGNYRISASADGYADGKLPSLTIVTGQWTNIEVSLVPNRASISGQVKSGSEALPSVTVSFNAYGISRSAMSGSDGKYKLDNLPAGTYSVSADLAGYRADKVWENQSLATAASLTNLDFSLVRNVGSLTGTLSGAAISSGIRIALVGKLGTRAYGACDGSGKYAIPSLPADDYTLYLTAPGYKLSGSTQNPVVTIGAAKEFNAVLLPAVFRLTGKLTNQADVVVSGLPVELITSRERYKTISGADGTYSFEEVAAGDEYSLACKPSTADYDAQDTTFALDVNADAQVTVNLHTYSRQASFAGAVQLDGVPVEGALIRLTGNHNNLVALSQPNGTFKLSGIAGSDSKVSINFSKVGANTFDTSLVVKIGEAKSGVNIKLKSLSLNLDLTVKSSENKVLAGAKVVVASAKKLDTLTASSDGVVTLIGLPGNHSLTIATLLGKADFDNLETSIFLKERDTAVTINAVVHTSSITAQVKDQNGDAVNGAEVILNGKRLGLTVVGKIQATALGRGDYRLAAGKATYKGGPEASVSISGDASVTVDLLVTKVDGGLYGTVSDTGLDKTSGGLDSRSLPGAVIVLTSSSETLLDTANSLGQYFVTGMVDGHKYQVALSLPGYVPFLDSIVASSQSQNLNPILKPFLGGVLGRAENGKSGIRVRLVHSASGQVNNLTTALGGYYAFTGLQNRSDYFLQALDGAKSSPSVSFQANGTVTKRMDLTLDLWGKAQGVVTSGKDSGSLPVFGALVSVRNLATGVFTYTVTDSLGRFTAQGLASGKYELSAERKGYVVSESKVIDISKGSVLTGIDFLLEEVETGIAGLVSDENGQGLSALITLSGSKDTLRIPTNGGGQFVFAGQPSGTYQLSALKSGFIAPAPISIVYSGKGLKTQNIILTRGQHAILGVVRDALTNMPVDSAQISVTGGPSAVADSLGRYALALPNGIASPVFLNISMGGYLTRSGLPVYLGTDSSAIQDIVLTADYKFDGKIDVVVKEGKDTVSGLILTVQPFHPDDSSKTTITSRAASSFRELRWPAPYTLRVKRNGYKDLIKVVELTAKQSILNTTIAYPTSRIRVFITSDGKHGKGVELNLNGQSLNENPDTAGLYSNLSKLAPGSYEVAVRDQEFHLIPLAPYFIGLGEDSIRTDTLSEIFFSVPIEDSTLGSAFIARVIRRDTLKPVPGVICSLYYRLEGDLFWKSMALGSVAGGFAGTIPEQSHAGTYQYYNSLLSPEGSHIEVETPSGINRSNGSVRYSNIQSPEKFVLRDPHLLYSIALLPQRLEADTSLYSLNAKDVYEVQMRGENGRSLNAYFDERVELGDTGFTVTWKFVNAGVAKAYGLTLNPGTVSPRLCGFHGGNIPSDSLFQVICSVHMGTVSLNKRMFIRIQDLWPVSIGIKYVKENRELEDDGATLQLANRGTSGYFFSAIAKTADGRIFNISPRWSFGADSAVGYLSQRGGFLPDSMVARTAALRIYDTLTIGLTNLGAPINGAFVFQANLETFTQVVPASSGHALVTNGEGTVLNFNLAGLSKAFTVSVKKPKVSGLLRSSPLDEVVGEIMDIDLSESQPFKADSGAVLNLPVAEGIARRAWVYLGHWNSGRLAWEKVDSAKGDSAVDGKVYSFSKYAVIMGSLPLGAYDFTFAPNPFSSEDPWGLQLSYKVSSDVSAQVGVRVEVYNMMGDKVYESHEYQLSKGDVVKPGLKKAGLYSSERRTALGPYVWDGHDSKGRPCRNGRYLIKLVVKDGQGSKTYLKKVVMLK